MKIEYNQYNNTNSYNNKINTPKIFFKGAKEDFGKFLANDIFQKEKIVITEQTRKDIVTHFKQAISDIISSTNLIGAGFRGKVYKIDNNLVMKISKHYSIPRKMENLSVLLVNNQFSGLKTYYGEDVLRIGNAHILKNAGKHMPAGVPNEITDIKEYYENKYLPTFAKIPQESYDAIAEDFAKLNKIQTEDMMYCSFDTNNPENIILSNNKLKMVDEISSQDNNENPNTVGKLAELLLYNYNVFTCVQNYGKKVNEAREILRKILIASEKVNLPYHELLSMDKCILEEVFSNCKLNIKYFEFSNFVEIIRKRIPDANKRIDFFIKFLDEIIPIEK